LAFAGLAVAAPSSASPIPARELVDVVTEDVNRCTALLRSATPERRVEGVQGLSHLKHWPAEDSLLALLNDPSAAVRREVVLALARLGTAKTVPRLIALRDDPSWELRENARLALERMTGERFLTKPEWEAWWNSSALAEKVRALLDATAPPPAAAAAASAPGATNTPPPGDARLAPPRRRARPPPLSPPALPERRVALRALRHLATSANEPALLALLQKPQSPPLDADERAFLCEALERVGTATALPALAAQHSDAAAWALGRIGGMDAERALLAFPKTLPVLLALDRLRSTNGVSFLPSLVAQMGLITYRGQPDDVMNEDVQPIQRVAANLIRRSGRAPLLLELVLQELEDTMKPPRPHGPRPACPPEWERMLKAMHSELKPGFVREDGVTTSQPLAAMCYTADDPALAPRLIPLLRHPAFVPRVYVALTLGRLRAPEALPALREIIREGYAFSDSVALASGKHFDQSQTVRWRGFLCMALGRLDGDEARVALEGFATDLRQPRDIRYSSVVGLGFIASPKSLPALQRVAREDVIWMVRDEAQRVSRDIELTNEEPRSTQQATRP
jgi:HEAT repeat protein